MSRAARAGGLGAALILAASSARTSASSPPPPPPEDAPDVPAVTAELRCEEMAAEFEARVAELRAAGEESIALLEAEEIARVADEILAEDDPETAAVLLEEALALLGAARAER